MARFPDNIDPVLAIVVSMELIRKGKAFEADMAVKKKRRRKKSVKIPQEADNEKLTK